MTTPRANAPQEMTKAGKRLLWDSTFRGVPAPDAYYSGVCQRVASGVDLDTPNGLAVLTRLEPAAPYKRARITPSEWAMVSDDLIKSPALQFTNDGDVVWNVLDIHFLATSPDDSGVLVQWGWLDLTTDLFPRGDILQFSVSLRFR